LAVPLIHMSVIEVECSSAAFRPDPLMVFSGPKPGWTLDAVAAIGVLG